MVPKLRFKEFKEQWVLTSLGKETSKIGSGSTPKGGAEVYQTTGIPFIRSQNVNDNQLTLNDSVFISHEVDKKMKGSRVQPNDILLNITGASIGRSCVVPRDFDRGNVNQHVCIIRFIQGAPKFYQSYLSSKKGQDTINSSQSGSGREGLNFENIRGFEIYIPLVAEQTKIANFLTSVDEKITLLSKQYDLLQKYKKGMMQKIFSQELRFKDDNGNEFPEWKETELNEIAAKVNTKNRDNSVRIVLTNSATQGIVSQESYFEREIVTESNLTGYYVVSLGDFVYNPRISANAPVGPIKMNKLAMGIMSPLYTVFRFKKGSLKFYQYFFESSVWHDYMKSVANSGARHDRMNISGINFFALPMPQPTEPEQSKISDYLSAIDEKITTSELKLNKLKAWKQGLLQQMFV
ncbi:restriction endonuclease subunit S [Serratia fonticola]|uniref:restriction endonuclease subunit S n=1 Tax=Serratia fonticola TaxID=47917 RepID=UPI002DB73170|nr:restriction endonuclease subunit S [Serratia fonticola]MEB7886250.1 restriction endonuclease subunit S [Serratia fonticola]